MKRDTIMKILVSALLLLSFLSACEQMGMNHAMDDNMAMGADTMDDNMSGM